MIKYLDEQRNCLYCGAKFTPRKYYKKGIYCNKTCSSKANGITFGKNNWKTINLRRGSDFTSNEEYEFYLNENNDE